MKLDTLAAAVIAALITLMLGYAIFGLGLR